MVDYVVLEVISNLNDSVIHMLQEVTLFGITLGLLNS